MRLHTLLVLLALVEFSVAQDTNFSAGPQYLVTTSNPMLLRSIATPSLSLNGETIGSTSETPTATEAPTSAPVETVISLAGVFWGDHKASEVVGRRVETPSMSPDQTQWYMTVVANQTLPAPAPSSSENAEIAASNVVELTGASLSANLPASFLDIGVTGMTDLQSLLHHGDGVSLGEAGAYWKARRRTAPRVFTNKDLHRN